MDMQSAVDEYAFAILEKSPHTQRWYLQKLRVFAAWCEEQGVTVEELGPTHVRRFYDFVRTKPNRSLSATKQQMSTYTVHGYAQVVKGFVTFLGREGLISTTTAERIRRNVEMPQVQEKVIEIFTPDQLKRLFAACQFEKTPRLAARDRAILAVLLDTGIRASELCGDPEGHLPGLTLDRVFLKPSDAYLRVIGKGNKMREVPLGIKAQQHLHRYITRFRHAPEMEKHVFLAHSGAPLLSDGLDQMLYRLRDLAGIEGVRCSAHTFRHTFACNFLLAGGDIYILSKLLGHTHVSTTEIYLRAVKAIEVRKHKFSLLDRL